jgi:hypothetical protein
MIQQLQRQLRDQEEKQQDFRIEVRGLFSKIKSTGSSFPSAAHDG